MASGSDVGNVIVFGGRSRVFEVSFPGKVLESTIQKKMI